MQDIIIELQEDLTAIPEAQPLINSAIQRRNEKQLRDFYNSWQPESVIVPGILRGYFTQEEGDAKAHKLEVNFTRINKRQTLSLREALTIMATNGQSDELQQRVRINGDLVDLPAVLHNIKSNENITIQILIDQHPDLVQLSQEQIKQANNLSPLSPIQIPNQIGSMIVLKPNLYLKQTVIQCFCQNGLSIDVKALAQAQQVITVGDTPAGQDFAIPMFIVDSSLSQTAETLKKEFCKSSWTDADQKLLDSAMKRLRFGEFCTNISNTSKSGLLQVLQAQELRRKFLFGQQVGALEAIDPGQFSSADYQERLIKQVEEEKEIEEIVSFTRANKRPNL